MCNSNANLKRTAWTILRPPLVASALVALALTALPYGDALALPLFADDLVQIPWLESTTWRELWTGPSPYGYYRPMWYSLWRVWGILAGGLRPAGLHLLNLIAHFIAAWLAGVLATAWTLTPPPPPLPSPKIGRGEGARRRGEGVLTPCLATAVFAAFPFAYQAIAWPGAVYNPLVSALAAGALLAYDRGRCENGTGWIGLAALLALISAFTYEAGLLVGPLMLLAETIGWMERRWPRRFSAWSLTFIALFIATTLVWRTMRGVGAIGFGLNPADLRRNVGYLVQGMIYPTAPLAQWLTWWDLNPEVALWLIALPTTVLLAWSGLRSQRGAFLLGAGWFALFALPPLISMEADWFALAPRFLYMTATGVALVWTAAANEWLARLRATWRIPAAAVLLAALVAPATLFVRDRVRLYAMAGESIWDAVNAATTRERPVLLVNLPMQAEPRRRVYPLGFEGVTLLPARVTADGLTYTHTGLRDAAQAVAFSIVAVEDPPGYTYQLFGAPVGWEELTEAMRQTRTVYLTRYEPERIHLVEAGAYLSPGPYPGEEPSARFGEGVILWEAECVCEGNGRIRLTTTWQVESPPESDATVFAHLVGSDGALVTQADGYPLLGMRPFWLWRPGEVLRDVRYFAPAPPGEYTIRLGLWDFTAQARLPAVTADGTLLPDRAVQIGGPCACSTR